MLFWHRSINFDKHPTYTTDMSDQEKALAKYVEKMYQIQYNGQDEILTPDKLKQVALDMGITEEEWQESQKAFQTHYQNGRTLVLQRNWHDAIKELDSATSLQPYDADALHAHAQALAGRYQEKGDAEDEARARESAERALRVRPGHQPTLKVLSMLSEKKQSLQQGQQQNKMVKYAVIGIVAAVLIFGSFSMRNGVVQQEEQVNAAWANVENVYQRRADLVPQLVNTVKGAMAHEQDIIGKITQIKGDLDSNGGGATSSQEALNAFYMRQMELSNALKSLVAASQTNQALRSSQAFRDLQVQLEGSENRISVERRKFNQAVQMYNSKVRQFPYSIFGSPKPYFQADEGAKDAPKVSF